jgi:predicted Ser/Thr protein kinase
MGSYPICPYDEGVRRLSISRAEYERIAGESTAKAAWHKPVLRPLELSGRRLLVKDYRPCPLPWRLTYGRAMVARESSIYAALDGLPGFPRFIGVLDALAFAVERIDGRDLSAYRRGEISARFLDRLEEVVRSMHGRGVVHLDLRQRRNVLVGPGDEPFVIDFASALRLPKGSEPLRLLALLDLSGVAKLRRKHAPDSLTERDREVLRLVSHRPRMKARDRRRAEERARRGKPPRTPVDRTT